MKLGSDVDALDALANEMERVGVRLHAARTDLEAVAASVVWKGRDADLFREQWRRDLDPATVRAVAAVRMAAVDARRQAEQQRVASAPGGSSPSPSTALGLVGAAGLPVGRLPVVAPAPERIRIVTVAVEGGRLIVGGAQVAFRVEDLGHGRSRVVETSSVSLERSTSASTRADLSIGERSVGVGSAAEASFGAMVGGEESWLISTDDLDAFLVGRGAEMVLGPEVSAVTGVAGSIAGAIPGAGFVADQLGLGSVFDAATYSAPPPERRGVAAGGGFEAGVKSGAGTGLAARGALSNESVVGATLDSTDGSLTLNIGQSVSASVAATASKAVNATWSGERVGNVALRLDRSGAPVALLVDITTTTEHRVTVDHAVVDLTDPVIAASAGRLVDRLGEGASSGNVSAAIDDVLVAATGSTSFRTDVYAVGAAREYGLELPVGSAMVTYEDLRLER